MCRLDVGPQVEGVLYLRHAEIDWLTLLEVLICVCMWVMPLDGDGERASPDHVKSTRQPREDVRGLKHSTFMVLLTR